MKKILSLFVVLAILLAMVPVASFAAGEVSINRIENTVAGNSLTITGTTVLAQANIYIYRPNGSVFDTDSVTISNGNFSYTVGISDKETTGTYKVVVGYGSKTASSTFRVVSKTTDPTPTPTPTSAPIPIQTPINDKVSDTVDEVLNALEKAFESGGDADKALAIDNAASKISEILSKIMGVPGNNAILKDIQETTSVMAAQISGFTDPAAVFSSAQALNELIKNIAVGIDSITSVDDAKAVTSIATKAASGVVQALPKLNGQQSLELVSDLVQDSSPVLNISRGSAVESKVLEKTIEAAVSMALGKLGTNTVAAEIEGKKAVVSADAIHTSDIIAGADKVKAEAAKLLEKVGSDSKLNVETKVVIDVPVSDSITNVSAQIPSEVIKAVLERQIDKFQISSNSAAISMSPDAIPGASQSEVITMETNKLSAAEISTEKMSAAQKKLITSGTVIYDFNVVLSDANGSSTKVSAFNSSIEVRIKYVPKAGENKEKITILYLADDGTIQNMIGRYDELSGEVIFTTSHFSKYMIQNNAVSFSDVSDNYWGKNSIEVLASKGIASGYTGNKFMPEKNITRAEFIAMLVKAAGVYDPNVTCDFTDVSKDQWFYSYVASAYKTNIAAGSKGKFDPNDLITREQMAAMLANAVNEKLLSTSDEYLNSSDADQISSWAESGMAIAVMNGFMSGYDNKLNPKGFATRAMAASVIYKYFNYTN